MKTYFQYIHYLPNWAGKSSAKWRNRSQPDGVDPFRWPKITHKTKNPIGRSGDGLYQGT